MAGAGYKLFNTGDVLTAAQVNTYLQEQVVMVFANAADRTTALSGVLAEGMVSFLKDTDSLEIYSGSAWVAYGSGDITGVTAGTGISGGGTSGTVTVTNSMATAIDAKGDLIAGTAADTFDRLAVGADHSVVQALASETTGLRYLDAMTTFTVTWTASTTNPVLNNGTLVGKYVRVGKMCYVRYRLVVGSTTTTGSGNWRFSLPFTAQTNSLNDGAPAGGYSEDNGVAGYRIVACAIPSAGTYVEPQNGTGNSSYSPTVPFTWATNDYLQFSLVYEVA
jgi:CheY-specific phosphatase CheX